MARRNPALHPYPLLEWTDPTLVRPALRNPQEIGAKELAAVTGVGVVLTLIGQRFVGPVLLGTGLYVLGYYLRGERPTGGWRGL